MIMNSIALLVWALLWGIGMISAGAPHPTPGAGLRAASPASQEARGRCIKEEARVWKMSESSNVGVELTCCREEAEEVFYFETSDFGRTWREGGQWDVVESPDKIRPHPADPRIQYRLKDAALLDYYLERSSDGGKTWTRVSAFLYGTNLRLRSSGLVGLHPADPHTVYITDHLPGSRFEPPQSSQVGLFVSRDGGDTFSPLVANTNVSSFAISESRPETMYVAVFDSYLAKSDDGGERWEFVGPCTQNAGDCGTLTPPFGETAYRDTILGIAIHPRNHKVVYAETSHGIWKTDDGGKHWCFIRVAQGVRTVDGFALVADEAEEALFAGTDAGLFVSRDAGKTWSKVDLPVPK